MSTVSTVTTAENLLAFSSPDRPRRRAYRMGAVAVYREGDVHHSVPAAACAWLSAHYRLVHGKVVEYDMYSLIDKVHQGNVWDGTLGCITGGHVRPLFDDLDDAFVPHTVASIGDVHTLAQVVATKGPVLASMPWPGHFDLRSNGYGEVWCGDEGPDMSGPYEAHHHRGVVIRGVSYRFNGLLVETLRPGIRAAWLPFSAFPGLYWAGLKAIGADFT